MYTPDELLRHGCADPELLRQALAAVMGERDQAIAYARNLGKGLEEIIEASDNLESPGELGSKIMDVHFEVEKQEPDDWHRLVKII